MKHTPEIIVQLIHIRGPLKGEIQEISEPEISIGRHPSCHIRFPGDQTVISRNHARIIREGNRFRLVDLQSTNGTFVNGLEVTETHLKDGDVLTIGEGGPQVSFLTRMGAAAPMAGAPSSSPVITTSKPSGRALADPGPPEPAPRSTPSGGVDVMTPHVSVGPAPVVPAPPEPAPRSTPPGDVDVMTPHASVGPAPVVPAPVSEHPVQAPLVIQFGPTLRSFRELPVTIGKSPTQGFALEHPAILDRHALVFFSQGQYMVKDLTGRGLVSINGRPVHDQAPLALQARLDLSPQGPSFRFLGDGRLAEIEEEAPALNPPPREEGPTDESNGKRKSSMFKRFFRR